MEKITESGEPQPEGVCGDGEPQPEGVWGEDDDEGENRKTLTVEDDKSIFEGEGSDGGMEVSCLSIGERLDEIDAKLESIYEGMMVFKERLSDLIAMNNSAMDEHKTRKDIVSAQQFENFVDQAILDGHEIGVGRSFIQQYLTRMFSLQPSKYLQRRLGSVLRRRVADQTYFLENNLYRYNKAR